MENIVGAKVGTMSARKSKGDRNNKDFVQGTSKEGLGFWRKMRGFLSCVAPNFKGKEGSFSVKSKQSDVTGRESRNDDIRPQPHTPSSSSAQRSKSCPKSCTPTLELKLAPSQPRRFTFDELKLATNNFKPENFLGQGGFGVVVKGWISDDQHGNYTIGRIPIAVKSLNMNGCQGHKEWLAEVSYLSNLHHPNLIKLVGSCIEDDKRLLAYEFMHGGSLENHLFQRTICLTWPIRMKIALGAAKGLAFLHENGVIFRDFKTSNILLDENYNPKLSDFGLAIDVGEATTTDQVVGTQGYIAPEYMRTKHLTCKGDVYSFGVVLLEMLTGRKVIDKRMPKEKVNLINWLNLVRKKMNFRYIMDSKLEGKYSTLGAETTMKLAMRCVCFDPNARPNMSEVVRALESLPIRRDGMTTPSPSTPSPSIPSTSLNRMHVGPSHRGTNKYGLGNNLSSNVPRRFQASPLG